MIDCPSTKLKALITGTSLPGEFSGKTLVILERSFSNALSRTVTLEILEIGNGPQYFAVY